VHVLAVGGLDEHAHGEQKSLAAPGPSFGVAVNVGLEAPVTLLKGWSPLVSPGAVGDEGGAMGKPES